MLSILIFLPLFFALLIGLIPNNRWVRPAALILSLAEFLLSLMILQQFDPSSSALQMSEKLNWISAFGISYHIGIDGLSLWLVLLSTLLTPLTILASWRSIEERVISFHVHLFILETTLIGTF